MTRRRTRESKRIPSITEVCRLKHVVFSSFGEHHRYYVAHPIEPGAQPCLALFTGTNGIEVGTDSVVILPENAPHEAAVSDPVYRSYLGLIKRAQARLISRLNARSQNSDPVAELIGSWVEGDWRNPPFCNASGGWTPPNLAVGVVADRRENYWWILSQWSKCCLHDLPPQAYALFDGGISHFLKTGTGSLNRFKDYVDALVPSIGLIRFQLAVFDEILTFI